MDFFIQKTSNYFFYSAFGLKFKSDIKMPEFSDVQSSDFDVEIKLGNAPKSLTGNGVIQRKWYEKTKEECLIHIDNKADILIQYGKKIIVNLLQSKVSLDEIKLFLTGSSIAVLLQQRNQLCLHASGIVKDNQVTFFTGKSGVGKSTIMSLLWKKRFKVIGDDVLPVTWKNEIPYLHPSMPSIKLWKNTLEIVANQEMANAKQIWSQELKYLVPLKEQFEKKMLSVKMGIMLTWGNTDEIEIKKLSKADAAFFYRKNVYRKNFLKFPEEKIALFRHATQMANSVPLYLVKRNKERHSIEHFFDFITREFNLL